MLMNVCSVYCGASYLGFLAPFWALFYLVSSSYSRTSSGLFCNCTGLNSEDPFITPAGSYDSTLQKAALHRA